MPEGTRLVDGEGKYLIPGLWDMHVHTEAPSTAAGGSGSSTSATITLARSPR